METKCLITFVNSCTGFSAVHSSVLSVAGASGPPFFLKTETSSRDDAAELFSRA